MNRTISISLPQSLIELIDKTRDHRGDPTRSDTVRVLLLRALADMSLVSDETKKALGISP